MEITRSGAPSEVQRCPFCHSGVGEAEEQVVCKRCLARHHTSCWAEGGRCASCQETTALRADGTAPPAAAAGDVIAPVGPSEPDEVRRQAARLLEASEVGADASASALLAIPTLGIQPIAACESAFKAHCDRNAQEAGPLPHVAEDLKRRIEEARRRAEGTTARGNRQGVIVLGFIAVAVLAVFGCIALNSNAPSDERMGIVLLSLIYPILTLLPALYMHLFREHVRRHEFDQFYARLVSDAVAPARIQEITDKRQKAWQERRTRDSLWTLPGLILGPLFFLPFMAVRARGALALHEEHEKLLDGITAARKDSPA